MIIDIDNSNTRVVVPFYFTANKPKKKTEAKKKKGKKKRKAWKKESQGNKNSGF